MHFPVAQRVPGRPLRGEEYGESKNTTKSDWFAGGFCHDSDGNRNLEHSGDCRRLKQFCLCCPSGKKSAAAAQFCGAAAVRLVMVSRRGYARAALPLALRAADFSPGSFSELFSMVILSATLDSFTSVSFSSCRVWLRRFTALSSPSFSAIARTVP